LSGKHAEGRTPRPSRKFLPLLVGAAVAAVLVGTSAATLRFSQGADTSPDTAAAAATRPLTSATPDRPQERADRNEQRITAAPETTPSSSPTPSPSPKPSKTSSPAPKPPSGGGSVVSSETCQASFYTDEGNRTANGEIFHVNDFTAAHKTLPFNTRVRVTNIKNGKSVVVRINDRGPFVAGRCLDLTPAAFNTISTQSAGVATVKYEVLSG
jgi:peptidoglycan lytic transglycosylase